MGRFKMHMDLANNQEMNAALLGHIPMSEVRTAEVEGWVDTGAAQLVLPKTVVDAIGVPVAGQTNVTLADGSKHRRDYVKQVWVSMAGRDGVFPAIVEPTREDALIGAVVLEILDLYVDPVTQECLPRDPDVLLVEIGSDEIPPTPR